MRSAYLLAALASSANALVTFAPLNSSPVPLNPFTTDCVVEYENYGPQTFSFVNRSVLHPSASLCDKNSESAALYSGSVVLSGHEALIEHCEDAPTTLMDGDIGARYRIFDAKNVSWVIGFGSIYAPSTLYKVIYAGLAPGDIDLGYVFCRAPKHLDWNKDVAPYFNVSAI